MDIQNKVFGNDDLRNYILEFVIPERCKSCHTILKNNETIRIIHYKDYNNNLWRINKNKYMPDVCNWCYYYVYEYP